WPSEESLRFWREQLAGVDPAGMRLPVARPSVTPATLDAEVVERPLSPDIAESARALRRRAGATEPAVLLGAYLVALRGVGAADDALVGMVVNTQSAANRSSVGYHTATLPLRVPIDPDRTFAELDTGLSRFDLELVVYSAGDTDMLRLIYRTDVHDAAFASGLLDRIEAVLEQSNADPARTVGDLDLRTRAEQDLVRQVNDTGVAWD